MPVQLRAGLHISVHLWINIWQIAISPSGLPSLMTCWCALWCWADKVSISRCSVTLKASFTYFGHTQCRTTLLIWELLAYAKQLLTYANDVWRFSKKPWVTKTGRMAAQELLSQPIGLCNGFKIPSQTLQTVLNGFAEALAAWREVHKSRKQWASEGPALNLGHW